MNNPNLPSYHNVVSSVRTPKVAILVNPADKYWKDTMLRVIEWCTRIWGGSYSIIVPTDGKTIEDNFWQILEKYSPDYIFAYRYTLVDLEIADPKKYKEIIKVEKSRLKKQFKTLGKEQIDDFIAREIRISGRLSFEITSELSQELKQRLSPFYFREHIVYEKVSAETYVPFPLTDVIKIIPNTDINRVIVPKYDKDKTTSLMVYSVFGKSTKEYEETIKKHSINVDYLSTRISVHDLLEITIKKEVDLKDYRFRDQLREGLGTRGRKPEHPKEDFLKFTPFSTSMLKLGYYTLRNDRTNLNEDTAVLVIGDSLSDFCLYYSLARLNKNVYWLPKSFVDAGKAAIESKRGNKLHASIASTVARGIFSKTNFALNNEEIHLISSSCDKTTLEQLKPTLVKLMLVDEPKAEKAIVICEKQEEHLEEMLHVIEQNNYANQHTEAFVNGKSVGFVSTPKPKNFKIVDPSIHRWITQVTIDDYTPPPLHFLDEQIILTGTSSYPTRISRYGLCYVSPNIGYFGGDVDTNSMRPKLDLVKPLEIFREYFREAGYEDIRVSDKGGYSSISIEKFGSLDIIGRFFKQEKNRNLIDKFLSKTSSNTLEKGEIVALKTIKRTFIDFNAVSTALGNSTEATELLDDFLEKEIFYRGMILQCLQCRNSDWYGIDELQTNFKCKRCNAIQVIKQKNWKDGNEPKWFYKLDEVLYQGITSDMHIPLLTLNTLKQGSKYSFMYIPEIELRRTQNQEKCDMEVDVCCIIDGEIVLGEGKTASIEPPEVNKYEMLVKEFKRYPDRIVFSSFENDWSQTLKESILKKINNSSFLFKKDLTV